MRTFLDNRAVMQKPDEGNWSWVVQEVVNARDEVSWQAKDVLSQWWEAFWDVWFRTRTDWYIKPPVIVWDDVL